MTKKTDSLIAAMDEAALGLLTAVNGPTITDCSPGEAPQTADIKGRTAAFSAVVAYLAVKHKIEPEGGRTSGIDKYRTAINGRAPGRGTRDSENEGSATSAEAD